MVQAQHSIAKRMEAKLYLFPTAYATDSCFYILAASVFQVYPKTVLQDTVTRCGYGQAEENRQRERR